MAAKKSTKTKKPSPKKASKPAPKTIAERIKAYYDAKSDDWAEAHSICDAMNNAKLPEGCELLVLEGFLKKAGYSSNALRNKRHFLRWAIRPDPDSGLPEDGSFGYCLVINGLLSAEANPNEVYQQWVFDVNGGIVVSKFFNGEGDEA